MDNLFTNPNFNSLIYSFIYNIPLGKVATYGDIAKYAGFPGYARQVGKLLGKLPADSKLPWHRVINAKGQISLCGEQFARQRNALLSEGIAVNENGKLNLKLYRWCP